MVILLLTISFGGLVNAESNNQKQFVFDNANLLTKDEIEQLEQLSSKLSKERNTAFIILTVDGIQGKSLEKYMADFYDNEAPGYDQPHGNTAILSIDMKERDVYLAGFKHAETYLDSGRLDKIRERITNDLTDGEYFLAFSDFMITSHRYMGYEPGVNPDNILFKLWFQILACILIAATIVIFMVYRSGGRVTVTGATYLNSEQSGIISKKDTFINKTVTKTKKPDNSNNNGGGSGGGRTSGGHSYSGSGGKF